MSDGSFEQFINSLRNQPFESDRNALLDNALMSSYFTTDQCIRLLEFCTFDSERKLTFSSDKKEVNDFIKRYHQSNNIK